MVAINGGVEGYSTWQQLHFLKNEGITFEPDLVILQFCFNDVTSLVFLDPEKIGAGRMRFDFSNADHYSGIMRAIRSIMTKRKWQKIINDPLMNYDMPTDSSGRMVFGVQEIMENAGAKIEFPLRGVKPLGSFGIDLVTENDPAEIAAGIGQPNIEVLHDTGAAKSALAAHSSHIRRCCGRRREVATQSRPSRKTKEVVAPGGVSLLCGRSGAAIAFRIDIEGVDGPLAPIDRKPVD